MIEKYRKHIYCQKGFIENCVSNLDEENHRCETQSALFFWNEIKTFLLSPNVKLYLDYDEVEFDNMVNDLEKRITKAARKGWDLKITPFENIIKEINDRCDNDKLHLHFSEIKIKNPNWIVESIEKQNAIFLLNEETSFVQKIQDDYGIVAIGSQDYNKLKEIFCDRSVAIHKKEVNNWKNILVGSKILGNSLILVDNFVLNDINSFDDNIKNLFDALLPLSVPNGITFQILIVTTLRQDKRSDLDCKCRFEKIKNVIDGIRPKQKYEISILKNNDGLFHDRTIITNYGYISSGAGFDLLKNEKSQKTTTVMNFSSYINPQSPWLINAYSNLLADLYESYSKAPNYDTLENPNSMPHFLYGKKGNRIIEEYEKLINKSS